MSTVPETTEDQACHSGPHGYIQDKPRYLNRLKRIEGQARGISRFVSETFAFEDSVAAFERFLEGRPTDVKIQITL